MKKILIINTNHKKIIKLYYYNILNMIYSNISFKKAKNLKFRF